MATKARSSEQGSDRPSAPEPTSRPTVRVPQSPRPFDEVPHEPFGALLWSFDGVVRRVVEFSPAAEHESDASPLRLFVESLDAEMQGKLRVVMRAGREAQTLPAAVLALAAQRSMGREEELFAGGAAGLQDLQRGHAIACATGFDLELTLDRWGKVREPESLDERVWLRFGRELARSTMQEWSCSALLDSGGCLQKLYLRRGKARGWSFAALIDRPSERAFGASDSARLGRSRRRVLTLQAAVGRSSSGDLLAVRRASMAVGARLGVLEASGRASTPLMQRKAVS